MRCCGITVFSDEKEEAIQAARGGYKKEAKGALYDG
jgi:hypothetical protein